VAASTLLALLAFHSHSKLAIGNEETGCCLATAAPKAIGIVV
jgi:hypothetical protein